LTAESAATTGTDGSEIKAGAATSTADVTVQDANTDVQFDFATTGFLDLNSNSSSSDTQSTENGVVVGTDQNTDATATTTGATDSGPTDSSSTSDGSFSINEAAP